MHPLQQFLQDLFDRSHAELSALSGRWDLHANRRTILALLFAGSLAAYLYLYDIAPPDSFPTAQLVSVPSGESLSEVARTLEADGVVRSALMLRAIVTLIGGQRSVHAGDYLFKQPCDVFSIARALSIGAYGLEPLRIRIPEGATTREMALIYSQQLERFKAGAFLARAAPQEGYFFPDTYFFMPNVTEDIVMQAMRQNFDQHIASIASTTALSGRTLKDIVIMASIVEREARNESDRRMIAGVLWNRLSRGMPLQVDVTFLYTIGKGTFELTMKDLKTDSPYNTYLYKGLPPGPIGSPSLGSLLAAAAPIKSDYLYYLADGSGVTHYSKTYNEHVRKKALYLGT